MKKKDIMLSVALGFSVIIALLQVNNVEAARKPKDYGLSEEKIEEAKEESRASVEAWQTSQREHEEAKARGEAGDAISSVTRADGTMVVSSVAGCYNTQKLGGGCAITSTADAVRSVLHAGAGEVPYASIMDSHTGDSGKAVLNGFAGAVGGFPGPILDIDIGKYTSKGLEYPSFGNTGLYIDLSVPSAPLGTEPVLLYYTPDGKVGIAPQWGYGSAERKTSSAGFFITEPRGVYMMAFVPAGSMANVRYDQTSGRSFSDGALGHYAVEGHVSTALNGGV